MYLHTYILVFILLKKNILEEDDERKDISDISYWWYCINTELLQRIVQSSCLHKIVSHLQRLLQFNEGEKILKKISLKRSLLNMKKGPNMDPPNLV